MQIGALSVCSDPASFGVASVLIVSLSAFSVRGISQFPIYVRPVVTPAVGSMKVSVQVGYRAFAGGGAVIDL